MGKILVTGGTGYIGSHTVVELINSGYDVIIVDNLSNSNIDSIDGIEKIVGYRPLFIKSDCSNYTEMNNIFKNYKIDAIIHFAALKSVNESVNNPIKYYQNNISSIINLLSLLNDYGGKYFIFSSSCTVYGEPDVLPVTELTPIKQATSPYGNTKKIGEDIIRDFVNVNKNISAIALRYFNPIGAHPSGEIGESPLNKPDNLIPFITQTAIGILPVLKIFGNDYDSKDGTAIRDYFHVMDLSKSHVLSLKRLIDNKNKQQFEVFNVGSGKGVTVLDIVKSFESVTNVKLNYKIVDRRPGDIEKVWADTSLIYNELGWKTEYTLEDALLSSWIWQKNYINKKHL